MPEALTEYLLFFAKLITLLVGLLIALGLFASSAQRSRRSVSEGHIEVKPLKRHWDDMEAHLRSTVSDKRAFKAWTKQEKQAEKQRHKQSKQHRRSQDANTHRKRVYVVHFDGDLQASQVSALREEITAILSVAEAQDEVVVCLESGGGVVHGYGLAASQLDRIRKRDITLTICVDKVAASGGYMMACIAERIVAAPFAILGSIGVVAQLPNFHRALQKHDIDFELHTAGDYKRTLTLFGENTEQGRRKFVEELNDIHDLFKEFVQEHRAAVDIDRIATGEVWYGRRAMDVGLADEIATSDEYLLRQGSDADLFSVQFVEKKSIQQRLGFAGLGGKLRRAVAPAALSNPEHLQRQVPLAEIHHEQRDRYL